MIMGMEIILSLVEIGNKPELSASRNVASESSYETLSKYHHDRKFNEEC